ncbi:putative mediator of RNA polymerase II transcription subunit 26 [Haliotis rufescens]|uniref:putative mediator of RNA polymerase II transcription subunit 26 n=1 Tax=Haliotis rufescens TaxID=6454 RepID=UPI00201EE25B|nr:putative mediator of RNA polymerase II transcription subunit 26 [Haliotis rufescens]XP_046381721.2 putative mediator of RNA polymerase II transcription subunit 26 [Haliotis rufescens]
MSPVKTLIGCLAVMGAVQAKEGNGGPPPDPPPDGQGILQIPPQESQSSEQDVGTQTQQLQPKRLSLFKQHQQQQRNHQQHGLRRVKTMDDSQAMFDIRVKFIWKKYEGLQHDPLRFQLLHTHKESTEQVKLIQQKNEALQADQFIFQRLANEIAAAEQVKLIQQKNEALQPDQLNYLTQLKLASVSVILIALTSVLIQKMLSPGQQSNQRTIQILQTKSIETESRDEAQRTEQRQPQRQRQHLQRARPQRSTCYDTKIPVSAVPWGQSVDILKTQGIQARTAQLLSGIITQLQAAATESATTACKHRLLDTCAGGLRAAALC